MQPWKLPPLAGLDWRQRNLTVETSLRLYLANTPRGTTVDTTALASALAADGDEHVVSSTLLKLAKWMGPLATHDGNTFVAYGKQRRRWRWHGQAQ